MKIEVRCWLEPSLVRRLDKLVRDGEASSRSEAVRKLLLLYYSLRPRLDELEREVEEQEERIRRLEEAVRR